MSLFPAWMPAAEPAVGFPDRALVCLPADGNDAHVFNELRTKIGFIMHFHLRATPKGPTWICFSDMRISDLEHASEID